MPSGPPEFPVACPKCGIADGYPFSASSVQGKPDTIRVRMRCRACDHQWSEDRATPAPDGPGR